MIDIDIILSALGKVAMPFARILVYIFFGVAAATIWLTEFLRLDKLPEPVKMILKIFFFGVLVTVPVFLFEYGLAYLISSASASIPLNIAKILYWFLAISLVEEYFKYFVVSRVVLKSSEFDEPVDCMIYMITSAMGFAALENILYLLPPAGKMFSLDQTIINSASIGFFRFIGATFLHALCSALIGYFLALSIYENRRSLAALGIFFAACLHGLYNFSIMELSSDLKIAIPTVILLGLAVLIIFAFKRIKKLKSVCLI
jgi:RsiW-degrading membrane proteinase PrsW (M82 family)